MSEVYFRPSTPLREAVPLPDLPSDQSASFTEARVVVQQFSSRDGILENMFTVEVVNDGEEILLKSFDGKDRVVVTALTYETANSLQAALSDALDQMEGLTTPALF